MQVFELADDLKVGTDDLIALLRHMGIPVSDEDATISDGQMAKVLAKMERERRAGHKDPTKAIRSAMEDLKIKRIEKQVTIIPKMKYAGNV